MTPSSGLETSAGLAQLLAGPAQGKFFDPVDVGVAIGSDRAGSIVDLGREGVKIIKDKRNQEANALTSMLGALQFNWIGKQWYRRCECIDGAGQWGDRKSEDIVSPSFYLAKENAYAVLAKEIIKVQEKIRKNQVYSKKTL